jgi:periplasmic copper chaperone A
MCSLSKLAFAAVFVVQAAAVFAQANGPSTIAVEDPWARATPAGAMTGAVYMTLHNKSAGPDRFTAASSDIAGKVQIHEMAVVNGVMEMRQLADGLPLPAAGSVTLKPGGYHVMLIGLKQQLIAGETFPLTLTFAKAGAISVTIPIRATAPPANGKSDGMGNMEMK